MKRETEALLLEVTELIKRLEADREEAEKALERERQRRKKLGMEIDRISLWRLQQLPAAVQKGISIETKNICYFSVSMLPRIRIMTIVVFSVIELQYLCF